MTKEERIAEERNRLTTLLMDLDENQKQAAAGLISSAAFLRVTLEDLEGEINEAGCTEEYTNGRDQSGVKVSAACQAYASLNTKYQSIIQKLLKITPPAPKPKEKSESKFEAIKAETARQSEQWKRQQERDAAFFEALRDGTATNDSYREFCAAWEQEH